MTSPAQQPTLQPGRISRRHVLRIAAAAAMLPAGILGLREFAGASVPVPLRWHGEVLGAHAGLTLWHPDPLVAGRSMARMRTEIARLERIFSLYRPDSEIAQLNLQGRIGTPSRDLVLVLDAARRIFDASGGAFDPTVQSLWTAHARHFADEGRHPDPAPPEAVLEAARALGNFDAVDVAARDVVFARPGLAITLNGIAQGYVTDRITDLLRNEGFDSAMVELGETRALGAAPDGRPFEVGVVNPQHPGVADRSVALADAALSVSGGYGLRFGNSGSHHIFDPATGRSANHLLDVAVIAQKAMWADALSTAIFVAGEAAAPAILRSFPDARTHITRTDGTRAEL